MNLLKIHKSTEKLKSFGRLASIWLHLPNNQQTESAVRTDPAVRARFIQKETPVQSEDRAEAVWIYL